MFINESKGLDYYSTKVVGIISSFSMIFFVPPILFVWPRRLNDGGAVIYSIWDTLFFN